MPRTNPNQNLFTSQASTSGTQDSRRGRRSGAVPSQHLTRSRRAAVQGSDSDDNDVQHTTSATQEGVLRVQVHEISEVSLKWAAKGLLDLPAIPVIPVRNKEANDSAALLVKLILISHHGKQIITSNKLKKAFKDHGNRDDFDQALPKAKKLLLEDFGFVLAHITPGEPVFRLHDSANNVGSDEEGENEAETVDDRRTKRKNSVIHFILINTALPQLSVPNCLRRNNPEIHEDAASEAAKMTMLSLSLLYIFMEDGDVLTDSLWSFLKPFGFDSDINHPLVGKVKDLLASTFVKQQYIILHNKSSGGGIDQSYCKWGARADLEFSRLEIINLCAKIFDTEPKNFGERFSNAALLEKRRTEKLQFFTLH